MTIRIISSQIDYISHSLFPVSGDDISVDNTVHYGILQLLHDPWKVILR